jgi:8-oxo-dGTP diphosphatase
MSVSHLAVKAFIVENDCVLLVKRAPSDAYRPDIWELPGGRLKSGEEPILGLEREVREETGLTVAVLRPIEVQHFIHDEGHMIHMIIFLCTPKSSKVTLSKEHAGFRWVPISGAKAVVSDHFHSTVDAYVRLAFSIGD